MRKDRAEMKFLNEKTMVRNSNKKLLRYSMKHSQAKKDNMFVRMSPVSVAITEIFPIGVRS